MPLPEPPPPATIPAGMVYWAKAERARFEAATPPQRKLLIAGYLASVGVTTPANWCAAFVSHVYHLASGKQPDAPLIKSAGARQWGRRAAAAGWKDVLRETPQPGDVWVFWRIDPSAWQGHIGIVVEHNLSTGEVTLLEGNVTGSRGDRIIGWRKYPAVSPPRRIQALRYPD